MIYSEVEKNTSNQFTFTNMLTWLVTAQVEAVLSQHPGVSGIVVFGVPDARLTEMVAACVQIKENWQWIDNNSHVSHKGEQILSVKTLHDYCKMRNLTG